MATSLPGENQHNTSTWHPEQYVPPVQTNTKVPGFNTLVDNILDFLVRQTDVIQENRESYRGLAEKIVENLLKDYKDTNTGPKLQ